MNSTDERSHTKRRIYLSMAVSLAAVQKATGDTGKSWLLFSTQLIKKGGDLQNIVKNGENGMEKKKKGSLFGLEVV